MQTPEEMRRHIEEKSIEDLEFRARLVADPKDVISEEFGIAIPDGIEIKVHECDMETIHLALPPHPRLQVEQLSAVAAGGCGACQ